MKIFVQLPEYYCENRWAVTRDNGKLVGVNEYCAYGYHLVNCDHATVTYSTFYEENIVQKVMRLGCRVLTGCDILHAWRNRKGILGADVVWTHTESHSLAVAFLCILLRRADAPKIVGQSVWLFDRWDKMSGIRKGWYRFLLSRIDMLTVHSELNLGLAKALFPGQRSALVLFGINPEIRSLPRKRATNAPIRILSLGSDPDRDWRTLIKAIGGIDGFEAKIGSRKVSPAMLEGTHNISVVHASTARAFEELLAWADMMVLSIKPNFHASGITCLQEAAVYGLPSVCSDVGGLRSYFSDQDVSYVPPSDPEAMRTAIRTLAEDDDLRIALAERAQRKMGRDGLSSYAYAKRHLDLSKQLLEGQQ